MTMKSMTMNSDNLCKAQAYIFFFENYPRRNQTATAHPAASGCIIVFVADSDKSPKIYFADERPINGPKKKTGSIPSL
jgi:hypothetical protein